jgi:hypothetical protein
MRGLTIFAVALAVLALVAFALNATNGPKSFPPEFYGEYDGFAVVGSNSDGVIVAIRTNVPDRYIKALQDAIALAEKESGRKVVSMSIAGNPPHVYLALGGEKEGE